MYLNVMMFQKAAPFSVGEAVLLVALERDNAAACAKAILCEYVQRALSDLHLIATQPGRCAVIGGTLGRVRGHGYVAGTGDVVMSMCRSAIDGVCRLARLWPCASTDSSAE